MKSTNLTRRKTLVSLASVGAGVAAAPAWAADSSGSSMANDPALIAAAQKEGQVVWYTSQIIDQFVRPAAIAFEKKYGIKVNYVRADSNDIVLRLLNEGKAGQVDADVFDGSSVVAPLKRQNLVAKWVPPSAIRFGKRLYDPEGYWAATNLFVFTAGYNTSLIPAAEAPKTFADLLDPKWKNKMTWNATATMSGAAGFIANVVTTMGEEKGRAYLRKLAQQNILDVQMSARQVLDQVIAGESEIGLNIFNYHALISAEQGAPVAWIPMQPAEVVLCVVSVTKDAPHPNAGKLLTEFYVGKEGQQILRDANYIPADPSMPPLVPSLRPDGVTLKTVYFSPEQIDQGMSHWMSIYDEYFK